eukprot:CAMPEP_0176078800 /NCGR_PEP_ID=MMETSP0120_2-20121206/39408_1 /TAXON_ID=160619 /ORGANISM="Kryptoperidinium foliaceum, Strain CCMP 1326" /LENGTH=181 /DNA_ID=CAMNT_0017412549 /DNA_START=82 /DNA_END=623 /DNA_ORIENTATION=+
MGRRCGTPRGGDVGLRQVAAAAAALAQRVAVGQIDAIVSSDLSRARQTADAIAALCPAVHRREDAGLREIDCGSLQGASLGDAETTAVTSTVNKAWHSGDLGRAFPGGGESVADVIARASRALRSAAELGSLVVVVAHGGVIKWSVLAVELFGGTLPAKVEVTAADMVREDVQQLLRRPVR